MSTAPSAGDDRDLVFSRVIDAPRAAVWRCWTEPELMKRWFTPAPWQTIHAEVDLRPGGTNRVVMRGPDGTEAPHTGVYLEVVPERKLVFTDAFSEAWAPSGKPFMVGIITLEDTGDGRTLYHALVRHWTLEDRDGHLAMGFHEGWGKAAEQLEATARSL
ncbi:SRPBCC family protein [Alsobacter sp. R-9]